MPGGNSFGRWEFLFWKIFRERKGLQGRLDFLESWEGGNNFWHVGEMGIFFGRLARFFKKFLGIFESTVDKFARWAYFQTLSC